MATTMSRAFDNSIGREIRRMVKAGKITSDEAKSLRSRARAIYMDTNDASKAGGLASLGKAIVEHAEASGKTIRSMFTSEKRYNKAIADKAIAENIKGSEGNALHQQALKIAEREGLIGEIDALDEEYERLRYNELRRKKPNQAKLQEIEEWYNRKLNEFISEHGSDGDREEAEEELKKRDEISEAIKEAKRTGIAGKIKGLKK